ncbi:glutathione S-transferase C-terminal domain-containing protein [Brachymonas sp. G13]|uniref:glutathione S-transferase family protein n=1 Tax=Brachymonas TaxID=28219 RepID=UPI00169F675F|nr:glutathione S-transferase C-terminal domain-containing protein [Brachymonas sp. J145]MEE1652673.1 glutathione S-transferase C-terminal domain-containing protein [Brachymonas sp. J145]NLX15517.1 glutathione S-transferase [Ramlibacter sp.]
MKLIGSLASPYVRKVRVVLAEKMLPYEFELENVWLADTSIGEHNPLRKIPVLLLKTGEAVYDSRVICHYLDTLSPVCKLLPSEERERLQVRCWEALTDGVLDAAILARLENIFSGRSEAQRCQAWIDHQLLKVDAGLAEMSRLLGDRPFCYGNQFSLADIAVGCTLGWLDLRFPEIDWRSRHANLAELQSRLEQRQSFIDTVPA